MYDDEVAVVVNWLMLMMISFYLILTKFVINYFCYNMFDFIVLIIHINVKRGM